MNKVLVVNDLTTLCNCSLNVIIPILRDLNVNGYPIVTGIYSKPKNLAGVKVTDCTEIVMETISSLGENNKFDGILTGFMLNSIQVDKINKFLDSRKFKNVMIDPVMGDDGYVFSCFNKEYICYMQRLISKSTIITPNLTELCLLCDVEYSKIINLKTNQLLYLIEEMSKNMNTKVITTGIKENDSRLLTTIYDNSFDVISNEKIGDRVVGTGDIFSAIVFGKIVNGCDIKEAVSYATSYISNLIKANIYENTYDNSYGLTLKKVKCY